MVSQSLGIAHFRFSGRTLWDRFGHENESAFLKISAQSSEAGDFLNIFLRFFAFWGSFSYKNFSYKKKTCTTTKLYVIKNKDAGNVLGINSAILLNLVKLKSCDKNTVNKTE